MSYYFEATTTAPSSIECVIAGTSASDESITSTGVTGWQYGPTTYGLTFTAQAASGSLVCYFGATNEGSSGAQTQYIDDFALHC